VFTKKSKKEQENISSTKEPIPTFSDLLTETGTFASDTDTGTDASTDAGMDASTDAYFSDADSSQSASSNGVSKSANINLRPSVISEGTEIVGEIRSNGFLTVNGIVRGTLSLHAIQVGATGTIDGNVLCESINIKGNFSGSLDCRDLIICSSAVADGNISFNSITIQRGGIVKGELKKKL
jgi:cytoskeletal protein CcmA (bactofilin family)